MTDVWFSRMQVTLPTLPRSSEVSKWNNCFLFFVFLINAHSDFLCKDVPYQRDDFPEVLMNMLLKFQAGMWKANFVKEMPSQQSHQGQMENTGKGTNLLVVEELIIQFVHRVQIPHFGSSSLLQLCSYCKWEITSRGSQLLELLLYFFFFRR